MRLKCWVAMVQLSHNRLTTSLRSGCVVRRVVDGFCLARLWARRPSQNRPLVDSLLCVVARCFRLTQQSVPLLGGSAYPRSHWAIENGLHCRDVTWREDYSQIRNAQAPRVTGSLPNIAFTILRLQGETNRAKATRAAQNHPALTNAEKEVSAPEFSRGISDYTLNSEEPEMVSHTSGETAGPVLRTGMCRCGGPLDLTTGTAPDT